MEAIPVSRRNDDGPAEDMFIEDLLRLMLEEVSVHEEINCVPAVKVALRQKDPNKREKFVQQAYEAWKTYGMSNEVMDVHDSWIRKAKMLLLSDKAEVFYARWKNNSNQASQPIRDRDSSLADDVADTGDSEESEESEASKESGWAKAGKTVVRVARGIWNN